MDGTGDIGVSCMILRVGFVVDGSIVTDAVAFDSILTVVVDSIAVGGVLGIVSFDAVLGIAATGIAGNSIAIATVTVIAHVLPHTDSQNTPTAPHSPQTHYPSSPSPFHSHSLQTPPRHDPHPTYY